jgi:hypothetical protein
MTTADRRVLELAIQALENQLSRTEHELSDLRERLGGAPRAAASSSAARSTPASQAGTRPAPNKGKPMSAAQKRKIARTMKARWAKLRASKGA